MKKVFRFALIALSASLTACGQEPMLAENGGGAPAASADFAPLQAGDAMLAYEHSLRIELPAGQLDRRVASAREACATARFGSCHILNLWHSEESVAGLTMRVSPAGVEPLIALASGEGGKVLRRDTRAEDLAEAAADNRRQEATLAAYAMNMETLSKRPDIAVSDLIALAREQAEVEQKRKALQQQAAQQTRRVETHLLTLYMAEEGASADSLTNRFADMWDNFLRGMVSVLEGVLYGLVLLPLCFLAAALWRWAWRRLFKSGAVGER